MLALKRLAAYMADFLILATILTGLQLLISLVTGGWPFNQFRNGSQIELWVLCTMSLPAWMYFIVYEYLRQQTIGKQLSRLHVIRKDGGRITLWQACLRTFIKLVPWELTHLIVLVPVPWWEPGAEPNHWIYVPNVLILIYITWLFCTKGRRGPQDLIVGTQIKTE
ncbi:RDD family protein [Siminovitchia fortis]|uniref:RDD family protein n=1 Tax=Siminovitchia fortis TaxID=254758 RepID=UPI0024C2021A|nr:RDD family protein [Siminovitchia fortis]WHY81099.1 RDD family protein [Siminovitchia fortis]